MPHSVRHHLQPQWSGLLFVLVHYLSMHIRSKRIQKWRNTNANTLTSYGLSLSSLLYWNYVFHSKHYGVLYNLCCAIDYVMISTTTTIASFPHLFHTTSHFQQLTCAFVLDNARHYLQHRYMNTYHNHQLTCLFSTAIALYRTLQTQLWSPFLLRMYSTGVCSIIFYSLFSRIQTLKQFRHMKWYMPWLWHLHATICQQTSIEIAYHYVQ